MKVEHYEHRGTPGVQPADPSPGNYYVSAKDGPRVALLAGPFPVHQRALDMVDQARRLANEVNPWAAFWAFGTLKMADGYTRPGAFNARLGL